MDFVCGLPKTDRGHDSIYVIGCRLTKRAHFIPCTTTHTARDIAKLFFDHIARLHGLPENIISDRDSRFLSQFWRNLFKEYGTTLK